jgi:hypothetical protein
VFCQLSDISTFTQYLYEQQLGLLSWNRCIISANRLSRLTSYLLCFDATFEIFGFTPILLSDNFLIPKFTSQRTFSRGPSQIIWFQIPYCRQVSRWSTQFAVVDLVIKTCSRNVKYSLLPISLGGYFVTQTNVGVQSSNKRLYTYACQVVVYFCCTQFVQGICFRLLSRVRT